MTFRLPCWLWLALLAGSGLAQQPGAAPLANAPEVLARDLGEHILRIDVSVKDMYGRQESRPVPITVYRPKGEGPFPLVVFNHGRAVEAKRAAQGRYRPEAAARYLVAKGFVVMVPNRIGYWETYGDFDPEYSACRSIEAMSIAASEQVLATVAFAKTLGYVDTSRWLVAGQSVGGLTAVATVGRSPVGLLGGINFSGGTGGNPDVNPGRPCNPSATARYWADIAKNAKAPMLWLYWQNDKFWGPDIPKSWHQAWFDGGGVAKFVAFGPSGEDGHSGLTRDMDHWLPVVDAFLADLGFTAAAIVVKPPPSGFADIADARWVPISAAARASSYSKFLEAKAPRAFAVGDRGAWSLSLGDYAQGHALGNCQRHGQVCKLYAVDNDVVWQR